MSAVEGGGGAMTTIVHITNPAAIEAAFAADELARGQASGAVCDSEQVAGVAPTDAAILAAARGFNAYDGAKELTIRGRDDVVAFAMAVLELLRPVTNPAKAALGGPQQVAILEALEWIPVSDQRRPGPDDTVLCWQPDVPWMPGYYSAGGGEWFDSDSSLLRNVTHFAHVIGPVL